MIVLLLCAAAVVLARRQRRAAAPIDGAARRAAALAGIALLLGAYDGFFGPGTGSMLVVAFAVVFGDALTRASGNAKIVNLASNVAAMLLFAHRGVVVWGIALPMAAANALGAATGAHLAVRKGDRLVRAVVLVVVAAIAVKLATDLGARLIGSVRQACDARGAAVDVEPRRDEPERVMRRSRPVRSSGSTARHGGDDRNAGAPPSGQSSWRTAQHQHARCAAMPPAAIGRPACRRRPAATSSCTASSAPSSENSAAACSPPVLSRSLAPRAGAGQVVDHRRRTRAPRPGDSRRRSPARRAPRARRRRTPRW